MQSIWMTCRFTGVGIYEHVGDPAYQEVPYAGLLSKAYATHRRELISETQAGGTFEAGDPYGK